MTDNDIIKAFTVCITSEDCSLCPMFRNCPSSLEVQKQALDLINNQKAEIEKLSAENKQLQSDVFIANQNYEHVEEIWEEDKTRLFEKIKEYIDKHNELITKEAAIRAEAVKEFALRLKGMSFQTYKGYFAYEITAKNLNDLVKEMAGD